MLTILDNPILPNPGTYTLTELTIEDANNLLKSQNWQSAIENKHIARSLSNLLGLAIPYGPLEYTHKPEDAVIIFKLSTTEKTLSYEELDTTDYKLYYLKNT